LKKDREKEKNFTNRQPRKKKKKEKGNRLLPRSLPEKRGSRSARVLELKKKKRTDRQGGGGGKGNICHSRGKQKTKKNRAAGNQHKIKEGSDGTC